MPSTPKLADLIALCAPESASPASVPTEIERLFRDHNSALLRFIAAKLGSESEAREVAQEAYVRLLRLNQTEAVSYLEALLFKTAANLALDRLWARSRRPSIQSLDGVAAAELTFSPEREMQGHQAVDIVRQALAELPQKTRDALLLHRIHGLNQTEIAIRLGLQERMVRIHMTRALEHLRRRLDEAEGQGSHRTQRSRR